MLCIRHQVSEDPLMGACGDLRPSAANRKLNLDTRTRRMTHVLRASTFTSAPARRLITSVPTSPHVLNCEANIMLYHYMLPAVPDQARSQSVRT